VALPGQGVFLTFRHRRSPRTACSWAGATSRFATAWTGATGKALWTFAAGGKVDSSPVVAGDQVVFARTTGRLYVVSLAEGRELWAYEIGGAISASPAVAAGRIVIGSEDGAVYCFGSRSK